MKNKIMGGKRGKDGSWITVYKRVKLYTMSEMLKLSEKKLDIHTINNMLYDLTTIKDKVGIRILIRNLRQSLNKENMFIIKKNKNGNYDITYDL